MYVYNIQVSLNNILNMCHAMIKTWSVHVCSGMIFPHPGASRSQVSTAEHGAARRFAPGPW